MTYILIYIAGFIASYYGWKLLGATHDWESVGFRLFISIFSWVSVVIGIALIIVLLIQDFFQNNKIFKNEPPKWL
jgi:TRAP-type C4-dicarboxylate transport system permease small subunit